MTFSWSMVIQCASVADLSIPKSVLRANMKKNMVCLSLNKRRLRGNSTTGPPTRYHYRPQVNIHTDHAIIHAYGHIWSGVQYQLCEMRDKHKLATLLHQGQLCPWMKSDLQQTLTSISILMTISEIILLGYEMTLNFTLLLLFVFLVNMIFNMLRWMRPRCFSI